MDQTSTIAAIATGHSGAIAVIRVSGPNAFTVCDAIFHAQNAQLLSRQKGFTVHFGTIEFHDEIIDEVLATVFRAPHSYTGENTIELSCHGSDYIQQRILEALLAQGATQASAGEFTLRAFLNHKFSLVQAEAVADIIAAENRETHRVALQQMRGGYALEFKILRDQLLQIASLLELELDFSEEDVEFADRKQLRFLSHMIARKITYLTASFAFGNALKKGVPVAIVGRPNVGKSTLLNRLAGEEKALVSTIPGTTRDVIEETINLNGIHYRFSDTAGIRQTNDTLESLGIERTFQQIEKSAIILLLVDPEQSVETIRTQYEKIAPENEPTKVLIVLNKADRLKENLAQLNTLIQKIKKNCPTDVVAISAKTGDHMAELQQSLSTMISEEKLEGEVIITNLRHYQALQAAQHSIDNLVSGLNEGLSSDLLTQDVRDILYHIGTITGEITTDDILKNIFSKFCIGK